MKRVAVFPVKGDPLSVEEAKRKLQNQHSQIKAKHEQFLKACSSEFQHVLFNFK